MAVQSQWRNRLMLILRVWAIITYRKFKYEATCCFHGGYIPVVAVLFQSYTFYFHSSAIKTVAGWGRGRGRGHCPCPPPLVVEVNVSIFTRQGVSGEADASPRPQAFRFSLFYFVGMDKPTLAGYFGRKTNPWRYCSQWKFTEGRSENKSMPNDFQGLVS